MREALVPGGLYVLSGPNSANAVKRVEAVVGRTEWSPFDEWYHRPAFRSHVREPSVRDLQRIAVDLELDHIQILGANWIGQDADSRARRTVARIADPLLRKSPALCSEIYLIGRRPR
jgi:hypothetical protein